MNKTMCTLCGSELVHKDGKGICTSCDFVVTPETNPPQITPTEAKNTLKTPHTVLLDVRTTEELTISHVDGAVHIPLQNLSKQFMQFSHRTTIIVMCRSGGRSHEAARFLQQKGFTAINLTGGINRWAIEVDPSLRRY